MSHGIYLFCLTPTNPLLEIAGMGMDPACPLRAEPSVGVVAIVSEVSLEDFRGPESRERLADLAWVAPRALRHEEVILGILRQAPVLPVRFGSVFSSSAALASVLERHRDALTGFFQATAGQEEWTLKAYVDLPEARSRIQAEHVAAAGEQLARLTPGKRYFEEQKIKGLVEREMAFWLKGMTDDIARCCEGVCSASSVGRLLSQELTGRADEMFFHAVLLVRASAVESLQRLVVEWNASHASVGLHLEASGPWPPYHFTPVLDTPE
jgi:hypothetical protein